MNGTIEHELILNTLQYQSSASELIIDPNINWPLFYTLIIRHRVWHQVHNAFKNSNTDYPISKKLANRCQQDTHRILATAAETVRISRDFTQKNIEHCFIKGTLLNVHVYGHLNTRPCRDIDVWVSPSTYSSAVAALLAAGYQQQLPRYELQGYKERWHMRYKHDIAFYHPQKQILVELHFRLSYLGLNFFPLSTLPLAPINLLNVPVMAPTDDYHLLYLMIHGAIHAWIRLRWLQDIALFIESDRCDLNHVYHLATQIKCQHIVEQTLILVNDLFKPKDPALITLLQKPSQRGRQLASMAHQFITADYEMTDGIRNINMFVKYRIYLARLAAKGQKLHAILGDLFKIDELFTYVTLPDKWSFMYYAIYPVWVINFIFKSMRTSRGT